MFCFDDPAEIFGVKTYAKPAITLPLISSELTHLDSLSHQLVQ